MNKEELLESLKCYISTIEETIRVDLIRYVKDEGIEPTDDLIQYLYNNIKDLKRVKRSGHTIKFLNGIKTEIVKAIMVYR
jgi:hypothetical protein